MNDGLFLDNGSRFHPSHFGFMCTHSFQTERSTAVRSGFRKKPLLSLKKKKKKKKKKDGMCRVGFWQTFPFWPSFFRFFSHIIRVGSVKTVLLFLT